MSETNESKPQAGGRASYGVPAEVFVEAWQASASLSEVAEKLGIPPGICSARASFYRRRGVHLKRMGKPQRRLDVAGLNRRIAAVDAAGKRPPEAGEEGASGFLDPTAG